MKYTEVIRKLNNFVRTAGINPGLQRIKKILKLLGNPEKAVPVIHIAGTNGKGSVTYMTTNALTACGYRVGTYTSPHLLKYNERFVINGREISNKDFSSYFTKVYRQAKQVKGITEFEILTALAFLYFKDAGIDVAVIETGLGGRFDATNIARVLVTIITPISFDHQEFLGKTLKEIAGEKAGILKKSVPVVTAEQDPVVLDVIMKKSEELENEIKVISHPIKFKLNLLGEYQRYNASLVIEGLRALTKYKIYIPRRLMFNGIQATTIPGRTELFSQKPLTVLDVAHNPQGIQNAIKVVQQSFRYKKKIFILGMLKRKDLERALYIINRFADQIVAVNIKARDAYSADEIVAQAKQQGIKNILAKKTIKEAYGFARRIALKEKGVVLVAGSFYLIGEFYKAFKK